MTELTELQVARLVSARKTCGPVFWIVYMLWLGLLVVLSQELLPGLGV